MKKESGNMDMLNGSMGDKILKFARYKVLTQFCLLKEAYHSLKYFQEHEN